MEILVARKNMVSGHREKYSITRNDKKKCRRKWKMEKENTQTLLTNPPTKNKYRNEIHL